MKKAYRLRILFFALLAPLNFNSAVGMEQEENMSSPEKALSEAREELLEEELKQGRARKKEKLFSREKVMGGLLALRKKLTGSGIMAFEDGSQLSNFSVPRDIIALIAKYLAKSDCYTSKEGARILLGLTSDGLFSGQKMQILKYLHTEKDAFDLARSGSVQVALNWKESCQQEVVDVTVNHLLKKLSKFFENKKPNDDYDNQILRFLAWACSTGDTLLKVTSAVLDGPEVDPNICCQNFKTPLMHACESNNKSIGTALLLLEKGAKPDAIDSGGTTALMFACENGDKSADVVSLLLEKGAKPNAVDSNGVTALMFACGLDNDSTCIASSLLDSGADPNIKSEDDETALMLVLDELKRLQKLADRGEVLQASAPNCENKKYALIRLLHEKYALIGLLLDHGAEGCAPDQEGKAILALASQSKRKQGQINDSVPAQGKKVVKYEDLCGSE